MNKQAVIAVLAATSLLFAEAYQVNTLSTKQLGMGHTGAGQSSIGVEGMHFNPGGLGIMNYKIDAAAGATFITPRVEVNGTTAEKGVSTPLSIYAGTNLRKWSFGMSVTTPYGNSAEWDKNWEGAELIQDISLKVIAFQPTIGFSILNIVGIGAGVTINTGSFSQSKALVGPGALNGYSVLAAGLSNAGMTPQATDVNSIVNKYKDTSAVSATLSGDADTKIGFNAGVMVNVIPKFLSAGVAYRHGVKAKVSGGKTEINYADAKTKAEIEQLNQIISVANPNTPKVVIPPLDKGTFEAELPLPANLNIGVSLTPTEKLLFNFDVQWIGWGAYDSLILQYSNEVGNLKLPSAKMYENSMAFRFGTQIGIKENLDVRLGAYFDQTPVPNEYLNPETPSTNKVGITTGCSFRPIPMLSIDAAVLYVRCTHERETDANNKNNFAAKYKVQAIAPSVGVSFRF
ncbi:MAG: outer membrane protein transport protein [Chitinivibrionia bacterium]|nr:outer membrane protein transport protein [Chitinivibrionia bacterium]MCL1946827.1 outer membrane protein transport protein [Chitinivibrionia bacterium]